MIKTGHPLQLPTRTFRPLYGLPTAAQVHMNAKAAGIIAQKIHLAAAKLPLGISRKLNH